MANASVTVALVYRSSIDLGESSLQMPTLDELRDHYVRTVLKAHGGNKTRSALALGIDRCTLYRMLERTK